MKIKAVITTLALLTSSFSQHDSRAAVFATFNDGSGDPTSVTINPGDEFTFSLFLSSTVEPLYGLTYFLTASTSGLFRITGRDITGSPFSDLTNSNAVALAPTNNLLNDILNNKDLGATVPILAVPSGTHFVASLTLDSDASIPLGVYTISLRSDSVGVDDVFDEYPISATYTVTVIPEPGVGMLLGVAGLAGVLLRRRRGF